MCHVPAGGGLTGRGVSGFCVFMTAGVEVTLPEARIAQRCRQRPTTRGCGQDDDDDERGPCADRVLGCKILVPAAAAAAVAVAVDLDMCLTCA